MKRIVMLDQIYGRLLVKEEVGKRVICECTCGEVKTFLRNNVLAGYTKSCGCLQREQTSLANTSHGHSTKATPTYRSWKAMKTRCNNPLRRSSHRYIERGITYDPAWEDFEAFLRDMGERPVGRELDRIDNNGNYTKTNCRWVTHKENCQNKD